MLTKEHRALHGQGSKGFSSNLTDAEWTRLQPLIPARIRNRFPWLELIWADAGYDAHQVKTAASAIPVLRIEVVRCTDDGSGFKVQPRRWVVERTLSLGSAASVVSPRTTRTSLILSLSS